MVPIGKGMAMDTTQAAFVAGMVICGTGILTVASALTVTAVCEWIDGAALRRSRRESKRRIANFRARCRARLGLDPAPAVFTYRKNGGLHFVKAGRFGAAVWVSRRTHGVQTGALRASLTVSRR